MACLLRGDKFDAVGHSLFLAIFFPLGLWDTIHSSLFHRPLPFLISKLIQFPRVLSWALTTHLVAEQGFTANTSKAVVLSTGLCCLFVLALG